jgi:uncharacterized protein YlxP (DUF503 family)
MVLKSVKDKIGRKYNASIAEIDHNDRRQQAAVGIAVVSNTYQHLESVFQQIEHDIEEASGFNLVSFEVDYL